MPQEYDSRGNRTWQVRVDTHENGRCPSYEQPHIHCFKSGEEYRLRIDGIYCGQFIDGEPRHEKEKNELRNIAYKYKTYCVDLYIDLYDDIEDEITNFDSKQLTLKKEF